MEANKYTKEQILSVVGYGALLFLFTGFLFNRVVGNLGFILAGVYAVAKIKDIKWLFQDKWMWTFMALAISAVCNDIWYEGLEFIDDRGVMKMVLVLFPSYVFALSPNQKMTSWVHVLIILAMTVSSFYSLIHFFMNDESIIASYKVSKVMPVLSYGDHIRISWVTVISMVLAMYEVKHTTKTYYKVILVAYIAFQALFLHFLGSKTGLITLYLTMILASYMLLPKGKKWLAFLLYILMILGAYSAVKYIPSLRERINFVKYDFQHYSKGEYREGLSDAIRYYSLLAGKDIISKHPISGVGFSHLKSEVDQWYKSEMPQIPESSYFIPSSEIVIYWAALGIIGLFIFILHLVYPLFVSYLRDNIWFVTIFYPAAFSFLYETHLEGQLPLFVYAFFVSWAWYLAYSQYSNKNV